VVLVVADDQRTYRMEVDGDEEETRKLREEAIKSAEKNQQEGDKKSEGRGTNRVGGFLVRAMQGFERIREKVRGKNLYRNLDTGEIRIVGDSAEKKREGEEEVMVEELTEIGEELDIEVELRESKGRAGSDRGSNWSKGTGSTDGYSFLELLEEEEQVEKKVKPEKGKRKREDMVRVEVRQRGLKVGQGWEERSKKEKEQEKWKIVEENEEGESKKGKIPIPAWI
jgi:hypothetical protein